MSVPRSVSLCNCVTVTVEKAADLQLTRDSLQDTSGRGEGKSWPNLSPRNSPRAPERNRLVVMPASGDRPSALCQLAQHCMGRRQEEGRAKYCADVSKEDPGTANGFKHYCALSLSWSRDRQADTAGWTV